MNTVAEGGLDWRAIAAGAGASIAIGMSVSFLMQSAFSSGVSLGYGTIVALSGFAHLVADAVGGAVAGVNDQPRRGGLGHGRDFRFCQHASEIDLESPGP